VQQDQRLTFSNCVHHGPWLRHGSLRFQVRNWQGFPSASGGGFSWQGLLQLLAKLHYSSRTVNCHNTRSGVVPFTAITRFLSHAGRYRFNTAREQLLRSRETGSAGVSFSETKVHEPELETLSLAISRRCSPNTQRALTWLIRSWLAWAGFSVTSSRCNARLSNTICIVKSSSLRPM
jgi:hypothetical protein